MRIVLASYLVRGESMTVSTISTWPRTEPSHDTLPCRAGVQSKWTRHAGCRSAGNEAWEVQGAVA
jgi:hypothetical protein